MQRGRDRASSRAGGGDAVDGGRGEARRRRLMRCGAGGRSSVGADQPPERQRRERVRGAVTASRARSASRRRSPAPSRGCGRTRSRTSAGHPAEDRGSRACPCGQRGDRQPVVRRAHGRSLRAGPRRSPCSTTIRAAALGRRSSSLATTSSAQLKSSSSDAGEVEQRGQAVRAGERRLDPAADGGAGGAGDEVAVRCGDRLAQQCGRCRMVWIIGSRRPARG